MRNGDYFIGRVRTFIQKKRLLSSDGLHLVALSGGADSVALLHILRELGYRIEAAHCNFHLRGEESDRDEHFVQRLCNRLSIPLHLIHFDTNEYAKLHQVSIEMAARELRYGYFRQLCQDIGAETVCVAHHRDDAVETFLMNLLRGSGIHGLTGIRPCNGQVVRPLLCLSRQDIEDFLRSIGQDYVTDSTNLEDTVLRNKIRLHVLPLLRQLNPHVSENIDRTATFLQEAERIFCDSIDAQKATLIQRFAGDGSFSVSIPRLLQLPSPGCFLHEWLMPYGFNSTQTEQLLSLLPDGSGREFVSSGHILLIDRDTLLLAPLEKRMQTMKWPEPGRYRYTDDLCFDLFISDAVSVSKLTDNITLDASKVQFPLTLRPAQVGDTFCPFGMTGHRLLSDFMTDLKLSVLEKRRQLVVTDAKGDIIWLVGLRTDHRFRVDTHTTSVLRIKKVNL